ncbi:MAG: hypothetical protein Athens101428_767 [Candidatus Berkelbacteria bacterium Athens1014_28]|uniref:Methyltransferase domain-containing protein n=1 Tax=Candidatus Berkelbacteria bacterium Athens1014_28 TaxID=2017145 RepID=A0A554LJ99_9BACT|nr:MAG: hypothetical protein Athens101428_767 [Candidatus Berkelbacteria bacterium Athens1014_28]
MIFQIFLLLVLLISLLILLFWLLSHIFSTLFYVPYVNASEKAIKDALELANLKKDEILLDLGCGRGDVLKIANEKFKVSAIGYEISPFPYFLAKFRLRKVKNVRIHRQNFLKATDDIKKADVIYLYLLNSILEEIEDWLFENISPKSRIVTLAFKFQKHKPIKIIQTTNLGLKTKIYLYKKD